jgi:hypothetical protein
VTEAELVQALKDHDVLVTRCVAGELPIGEFLERYDNFPYAYALDGHESTEQELALLGRYRDRVQFHFGVQETLSGLCREEDANKPEYRQSGRFGPSEALSRLRQFVGSALKGASNDG